LPAFDVCVSELVGPIASMEGVVPILNAMRRHLTRDGVMIPFRSTTKIAAVSLPESLRAAPSFRPLQQEYVRKIFELVDRSFDLRLCIRRFPEEHVLSNHGVFEDLIFNGVLAPEYSTQIDLAIQREGRLDGFLLWLELHTSPQEYLDTLRHEHCWLPVFLPAFDDGVWVTPGDRIKATATVALSRNGLNPDYALVGSIATHADAIPFAIESPHL